MERAASKGKETSTTVNNSFKCVPCEIRYKYIVHQTDEQNIINTVYGEIAATGTTEGPERTLPDENEELLATVDRAALELVYKRFFGDFVYFGFSSSYVRKILTASKYRKNDEIWAEVYFIDLIEDELFF